VENKKQQVVIYGGIMMILINKKSINEILQGEDYNFLKTNLHLANNMILLGLVEAMLMGWKSKMEHQI
jgi:hypothetical protein